MARPGAVFCYSDVGFITLGELAAAVAGCGLDELVQDVVCAPLGMTATRYLPPGDWSGRIAATEIVGGRAKVGVVHDENAEALGGVAGHAGPVRHRGRPGPLRGGVGRGRPPAGPGTARWPGPGTVRRAGLRAEALRCQTDGLAGRAPRPRLGAARRRWDNMGDGWPASGAGHTGFTGTSLSVDPVSGLWAVLLTNAVHFGRGP